MAGSITNLSKEELFEDPASLFVSNNNEASLILDDGTVVKGTPFGANRSIAGEVVFNTGMVGYPESLTDPSYRGQILVLTFPLIGNYGVPDMNILDEWGLPKYFESNEIHIAGLVVANYSEEFSHWNAFESLGSWLKRFNIPAITGVDTRLLTKKIREKGSMLGKIEFAHEPIPLVNPNITNLVSLVSTKEIKVYNKGASPKIVAIDCGMKYNIIRQLLARNVELTVVPYDHDFEAHPIETDGLFLSNGPGDPSTLDVTVKSIRKFIEPSLSAITSKKVIPVFGICLGNQLMAIAAGAKTYKLRFGNRGVNQPAIDLRTGRCYITPQNHGYAVDVKTLPKGWTPLFLNANDLSNEGITHSHLPYFSAQFHPEAAGGPTDTDFLFDLFIERVKGLPPTITTVDSSPFAARSSPPKKVLLLGSGGLSIGQAGEFDYSGSQAIKALKEEGVQVILINPNVATVQTSKGLADRVYFLPVTPPFVTSVIEKERPDGILISMGGQTALNVGLALEKDGTLAKYNVRVLGTPTHAIEATEDREVFSALLAEIGETVARSEAATSVEGALIAANKIGYPVLVRAAFSLGGLGSGFASNDEELKVLAKKALAASDQLLIDQDLRGWKEVEYEVVRDSADNCITVCNMENFDPLGVHTGDSIVVAPSQTLSNAEYFRLRQTALKVVRRLGVVGECNIQYALDPFSLRYCIIEVNARLSRSSALASKATGYPLAYVAAKLALGHDLVGLKNSITKTTTACFEPALDYCVVKVPRWDLSKFGSRVDRGIGSAMKSVGEVMAIGRGFEEAIQKALRMVNPSLSGFEIDLGLASPSSSPSSSPKRSRDGVPVDAEPIEQLEKRLRIPSDTRLVDISTALSRGMSVDHLHSLTKIDRWFLSKLFNIAQLYRSLKGWADAQSADNIIPSPNAIPAHALRTLKRAGFSDRTIASVISSSENSVRRAREALGIKPAVKQIDTLAAEFPAQTNYLYCTYWGDEDDVAAVVGGSSTHSTSAAHSAFVAASAANSQSLNNFSSGVSVGNNSSSGSAPTSPALSATGSFALNPVGQTNSPILILGGGPYCIGSSVEFDWCAVSASRTLRAAGIPTVLINCNPETVSTDYDESDRLYFEELSLERVLDVYERESVRGVIVSVGGQIPNNLAVPLYRAGCRILGTAPSDIDRAEDRHKFSRLLDTLGVDQPPWRQLTSLSEITAFVEEVGFPVLVRPSYVLSGAAMRVAANQDQLRSFLSAAALVSPLHPVVVSKFIEHAKEIELDAVAQDGVILNYAISEHVENAGVHSGDATLVLPAQKLYVETIRQIKRISSAIAKALRISGPFNMQFMSRANEVKVIECNLRASRSFPFISKTLDFNFIHLATRVMAGLPVKRGGFSLLDLDYVGVKAPQFSFTRLQGADPTLGVEMVSTGEVACYGHDMYEAFLLSMMASGLPQLRSSIPETQTKESHLLVSIASFEKSSMLDTCRSFLRMGYTLWATAGTQKFLQQVGIESKLALKPSEIEAGAKGESVQSLLQSKFFSLVINSPETGDKTSLTDGFLIRRAAVDFGVPLVTNGKVAALLATALERGGKLQIRGMDEYYQGHF